MDIPETYGLLYRVASLIASRKDRTALLNHHRDVSKTILGILTAGRTRRPSPSPFTRPTKDNPTGNPFKKFKFHKGPTFVSSQQDRDLAQSRFDRDTAADAPD